MDNWYILYENLGGRVFRSLRRKPQAEFFLERCLSMGRDAWVTNRCGD